jgi:hypothetical protein
MRYPPQPGRTGCDATEQTHANIRTGKVKSPSDASAFLDALTKHGGTTQTK